MITSHCPSIDSTDQSNLVRLYRLASADAYWNPISSFLFYYHILSYKLPGKELETDVCVFINNFVENQDVNNKYIDDNYHKVKKSIDEKRIFELETNQTQNKKKYDGTLGQYIDKKVKDSISHIIRSKNNYASDLYQIHKIN